ncbi:MAG TPA: HAMP domain-containing sensor histidine kinase [Polyangiaceae bacterium]|jgi:signal transduction histidine kinase|nr:HAMP domain-containing sensor histidine kinase [Polyangiaceae bacterium]
MPTRSSKRVLFRVYLYGILMLVFGGGAIFVVGAYVERPPSELPTRPSTAWIAWHMSDLAGDPEKLTRELKDLKRRSRIEMSLYASDGTLIGSSVEPPLPALSAVELERAAREPTHFADGLGWVTTTSPDGKLERYVSLRYPQSDTPLRITTAQVMAALIVLALLSVMLARSLTVPVERLAEIARAFGQGDLALRARSKRQDELGDLSRTFDEMADRLVAMRRAERELLANISHELRTPLARIRMALDLVRDRETAAGAGYFEDIEEDLGELEVLLNDVMTTARLDLERHPESDPLPPLRRERVEGERLLDAARTRFERRSGRTLRCNFEPALPHVDADPALLRRVVDNLLDNAAKFSEPGQLIELEGVREQDSGSLLIRVRDHGIGIEPDDLKRVFEPFFRADRSRHRTTGGVGLGLTLALRIVRAHGGELSVESSKAAGTCFSVRVPALAQDALQ